MCTQHSEVVHKWILYYTICSSGYIYREKQNWVQLAYSQHLLNGFTTVLVLRGPQWQKYSLSSPKKCMPRSSSSLLVPMPLSIQHIPHICPRTVQIVKFYYRYCSKSNNAKMQYTTYIYYRYKWFGPVENSYNVHGCMKMCSAGVHIRIRE